MQLPKKLQPVTDNEILYEVSKELKIDIKDVKRTYKIWLKYLDYIANETDQANIFFPHLGQMYVSWHKIKIRMFSSRQKKFRDMKLREIEKVRAKSLYNIHDNCPPIILRYGVGRKNAIPYILGNSETTDYYTVNDIVNNQTKIFFKEDIEFSENEKLQKYFLKE